MSSSFRVRHHSNKSNAYTSVVDKSTSSWSFSPTATRRSTSALRDIRNFGNRDFRLVGNLRIANKYREVITFSLSIPTTLTAYTLFTYYIHRQVLVNNYGNVSALSCLNVKRLDTKTT